MSSIFEEIPTEHLSDSSDLSQPCSRSVSPPASARSSQSSRSPLLSRVFNAITDTIQESVVYDKDSEVTITIAQVQVLIELLNFSVCLVDLNGNILHANSVFTSLMNQPSNLLELVDPSEADYFFTAIKQTEKSNDFVCRDIHTISTKLDDNASGYLWSFRRIPGLDCILASCSKVIPVPAETKKRNLPTKRLTLNDAKLTNQLSAFFDNIHGSSKRDVQLEESQRKLDVANGQLEMKRTFVRYVSHEIRTPLSVVSSGLQMLQVRDNDEEKESLEDIKSACSVAIDILNDLLTYEKLESDLLTLDKAIFDISDIVRKTIRMFNIQAKNSCVGLLFENKNPSTVGLNVEVDSAKISQVLRNLVSNALKFTPTGGTIHVTITEFDRASNRVRVVVQDTGAGMSKENRKRLFNEIVQFDPATLQNGQGSGLGLYLTRRIVSLHGGSIGVDLDWDGVGSIFYLELSVHSISELNHEPQSSQQSQLVTRDELKEPSPLVMPPLLSKLSLNEKLLVLLVDDSASCRKLHRRILKPLCYNILEACDGTEAVTKVQESLDLNNPFDIIFMDNSMPNMNGYEAAAKIRELGYKGKLFGVTGNAFQSEIDSFVTAGADQVLVKPVSVELFTTIVAELSEKFLRTSLSKHQEPYKRKSAILITCL